MSKFTWTQLMTWEREAVRRRVPLEIPGLIPRNELPNNRHLIRPCGSFERNGEKVIFSHITFFRLGLFGLFFLCGYQVMRVMKWGWEFEVEHHNFEQDNLVYHKLSCNMVPYHESVIGFP